VRAYVLSSYLILSIFYHILLSYIKLYMDRQSYQIIYGQTIAQVRHLPDKEVLGTLYTHIIHILYITYSIYILNIKNARHLPDKVVVPALGAAPLLVPPQPTRAARAARSAVKPTPGGQNDARRSKQRLVFKKMICGPIDARWSKQRSVVKTTVCGQNSA
jgi:hypothetical protein